MRQFFAPADIGAGMSGPKVQEPTLGNNERGLKRQTAILQAARALFVQHGYKRTTLEAIIAAAGGSREMIYKSFGGKQGLFGAIIADVGSRLAASIVDVDVSTMSPQEGLSRMGTDLVTLWKNDEVQAVHRVVVSEGLDAPEIMRAWYRGGPGPFLSAVTRYFDSQRRAGRLTLDDPEIGARQFVLLLMGELAYPTMSGSLDAFDGPAAVERTVGLMLRAYGTPS